MRFNRIIKIVILITAAGLASLSVISPVKGQSDPAIIALLRQILQCVNNLPTYISAWTATDNSNTSTTLTGTFQQLGQSLIQGLNTQDTQTALNNYLLSNDGNNVNAFDFPQKNKFTGQAPTTDTLPYGNDLVYASLLGSPLFPKDPRGSTDYAMNYILNASGSNLWHQMPQGFHGKPQTRKIYQAFYNTVMAATTFNNYVLSTNYADSKNPFTPLQQTLITQATDPNAWFAQVGSENIGFVLRQLLMYQSQVFVLLTQMMQLQKQMVSAQAINTAVLMANNSLNEASMAGYASGTQFTP